MISFSTEIISKHTILLSDFPDAALSCTVPSKQRFRCVDKTLGERQLLLQPFFSKLGRRGQIDAQESF